MVVELIPTPLQFTQRKNCLSDHGVEVPKTHILRPTLSIDMAQRVLRWERQKTCFGRKGRVSWQKNIVIKFNELDFEEEKMKTR